MLRGLSTIRVPQLKKLLIDEAAYRFPEGGRLRLFSAAETYPELDFHDATRNLNKNIHIGCKHPTRLLEENLPGANKFDITSWWKPWNCDGHHDYFLENIQRLEGMHVNKDDAVVLVGNDGPFGGMQHAAYAYWLLKTIGMDNIAVLEGGLERWKEEGGETVLAIPKDDKIHSKTEARGDSLCGTWTVSEPSAELFTASGEARLNEMNVLDCGPAEDFTASDFDKNVPVSTVIAPNGEVKSAEEILQILHKAGIDSAKRTLVTCDEGGEKSPLMGLALEKAGVKWSLFF